MGQAGHHWRKAIKQAWIANRMDIDRLDLEYRKKPENQSIFLRNPDAVLKTDSRSNK